MTGISCRSSDRKKPKKYHKKPKNTEKNRKSRKIPKKKPKKTERYRKFQIWDWFFSVFFGLQPPHGCAMGSPLAPILADILMNHFQNLKLSGIRRVILSMSLLRVTIFMCNGTFYLKVFVRYVDDTLAAFDTEEEADRFLEYLIGLHPRISFSCDKEV